MKLGDLIDAIRRVESAERDVVDAQQSWRFGGNAATMKAKTESVERAERLLYEIRNETFPEELS